MARSKYTTLVCCIISALTLIAALGITAAGASGAIGTLMRTFDYTSKLFDTSFVHSVDIIMDAEKWQSFLANAESEEYAICSVKIDGELIADCAIRAKGNTSLSSVRQYGNDRYSFKIEFDHYDDTLNYYGLDKLVLNNNIQDNTLMKDYLTYRMMAYMGVAAPLVSYAFVTVNGEDFGLYLALEAVEESFLQRNYGAKYGRLYKPDSVSMGGGRGNGRDFDMQDIADKFNADDMPQMPQMGGEGQGGFVPDEMPQMPQMGGEGQGGFAPDEMPQMPQMSGEGQGGFGGMLGTDDVALIYSDDAFESYSNIFDNAKTSATSADKTRLIAALKKLNANEAIESVVDIDQVIRYFAVHNFVDNFDSYTGSMLHNYYLYEQNGRLSMIPWDYNLAFGGFVGGNDATQLVNWPIDSPVYGGDTASRPMLAWIFQNEEYTALYHAALKELTEGFFESGEFETLFAQTYALIAPYAQRDTNGFCTYAQFEQGAATLKQFCLLRAQSVAGQLSGSIPSTSQAQAADSSALIDASALNVSDMGGMNMNGGFANGFGGGSLEADFGGQGGAFDDSFGGQGGMPGRGKGGKRGQ